MALYVVGSEIRVLKGSICAGLKVWVGSGVRLKAVW